MVNWRDHIETTPDVMGGKPVVRGTRVTVEILLELLTAGWSEDELLRNYPRVSPDALKAVYAFARDLVAGRFYSLTDRAA